MHGCVDICNTSGKMLYCALVLQTKGYQMLKTDYDYLVKVLLMGDREAKSSVIRQFRQIDRTKFKVWDMAGQERFQTITSAYCRGVNFMLYCRSPQSGADILMLRDVSKHINSNVKILILDGKNDSSYIPLSDDEQVFINETKNVEIINYEDYQQQLPDLLHESFHESLRNVTKPVERLTTDELSIKIKLAETNDEKITLLRELYKRKTTAEHFKKIKQAKTSDQESINILRDLYRRMDTDPLAIEYFAVLTKQGFVERLVPELIDGLPSEKRLERHATYLMRRRQHVQAWATQLFKQAAQQNSSPMAVMYYAGQLSINHQVDPSLVGTTYIKAAISFFSQANINEHDIDKAFECIRRAQSYNVTIEPALIAAKSNPNPLAHAMADYYQLLFIEMNEENFTNTVEYLSSHYPQKFANTFMIHKELIGSTNKMKIIKNLFRNAERLEPGMAKQLAFVQANLSEKKDANVSDYTEPPSSEEVPSAPALIDEDSVLANLSRGMMAANDFNEDSAHEYFNKVLDEIQGVDLQLAEITAVLDKLHSREHIGMQVFSQLCAERFGKAYSLDNQLPPAYEEIHFKEPDHGAAQVYSEYPLIMPEASAPVFEEDAQIVSPGTDSETLNNLSDDAVPVYTAQKLRMPQAPAQVSEEEAQISPLDTDAEVAIKQPKDTAANVESKAPPTVNSEAEPSPPQWPVVPSHMLIANNPVRYFYSSDEEGVDEDLKGAPTQVYA